MSVLAPELLTQVLDTSREGAAEVAAALERALDIHAQVHVGPAMASGIEALASELEGPGLAVVFTVGDRGAAFVLPESSGMLPPWCAAPDPTGQSRLNTLAQELGLLLLPEQCMPERFAAGYVAQLGPSLVRAKASADGVHFPLLLRSAQGAEKNAYLLWPLERPDVVLAASAKPATSAPPKKPPAPAVASKAPAPAAPLKPPVGNVFPAPRKPSPRVLPGYARSLLRISLPVIVTLARKRQPLRRLLELGPGSIIQFDKSCEEMLELEVGGRTVATGEAVKVGDKFGLRVNAIVMPEERFSSVKRPGRK